MKKDNFLNGDNKNQFLDSDKICDLFFKINRNFTNNDFNVCKKNFYIPDKIYDYCIENNISLIEKDYYSYRKKSIKPYRELNKSSTKLVSKNKKYYFYGDTDLLMILRLEG